MELDATKHVLLRNSFQGPEDHKRHTLENRHLPYLGMIALENHLRKIGICCLLVLEK